jgi:hypothetical protein
LSIAAVWSKDVEAVRIAQECLDSYWRIPMRRFVVVGVRMTDLGCDPCMEMLSADDEVASSFGSSAAEVGRALGVWPTR